MTTTTSTRVLGGAAADAADVGMASTSEDDVAEGHEWILDAFRSLEPGNYLREFTNRNVRPDGRTFSSCRPVSVLRSVLVRNSRGSASITLGGGGSSSSITRVVGACTLLVGRPGPSTPDHGDFDVALSASPLSGPGYDVVGRRAGGVGVVVVGGGVASSVGVVGADEDVVVFDRRRVSVPIVPRRDEYDDDCYCPMPTDVREIESWIRRTLRSSGYLDPSELSIERGNSAWRVRLSLHLIEDGGNACDAALLCACAALADLRLPTVTVDGGGNVTIVDDDDDHDDDGGDGGAGRRTGRSVVGRKKGGRSLTLGPVPVPLTVAILPRRSRDKRDENDRVVGPVLLADPTALEEDASGGNSITIVCNSGGDIVGLHKGGGGRRCPVSTRQMAAIASMGLGRARELEGSILGERI